MAASPAFVLFLIASHMTVSSTMLVLNKAVLARLPVATTVLLFQVGSSALILWVLGKAKLLQVDAFEFQTAKAFFWNAAAFMALIYSNAKALQHANVETVVAVRTLSIFVTAYGDFRLLSVKALDAKSFGALCMVSGGAVGYFLSGGGMKEGTNMGWVLAYCATNAAYPIVTKLVMMSRAMTTWGRTYYNNLLTFIIFIPAALILREDQKVTSLQEDGAVNTVALSLLALSCLWGTAISFLGFLCLDNVSATTFNLMGNVNKILTLVVNGLLGDSRSPLMGNVNKILTLVVNGLLGDSRSPLMGNVNKILT
eukprot:CAMPEP_0114160692 /NCGR_PEP_ID=MMETSP0043_2-20121206/28499_1 /TAXON_ID=464988 /ORGANISM="Hemiselmis andersenii, Strain CCMP644" /LENGTH=310 /DNA_ID=CAMNT_0001256761 /DNA_START=83 /DNA_END=1012 /DNA_ORIENTATION=+